MTALPTDLFTAIDHVGVAVPDLDDAIAFYSSTYGMRLLHEETNAEQGVREAMMAVGDSGSCIQLLAPLSPESTIAKFLDRSGPGIQQLAYRVADLDAVSATLRERGMRLLYPEPKRGTSNSRVNFIHPKDAARHPRRARRAGRRPRPLSHSFPARCRKLHLRAPSVPLLT